MIAVLVATSGCERYHELPLTAAAVDAALAPPDEVLLRVRAADLHHPRLAPLVIDLAQDLDPEQIAVVAVLLNPGLRALRDERALAAAQVLQAGLLPNPQLSVGSDLAVRSPDGSARPGRSLGLGWEASALVSRGAHRAAAGAHADAVELDIAWQEWQVSAGARLAAVRLAGAHQRLIVTEQTDQALAEQFATLRRASVAGMRSRLDEVAAATAAAEAHAAVLDLRQECAAQRLQLNRALGFPPDRQVGVRIEAWPTALMVSDEALTAGLADQRLDLLALRLGYESQEQAVRAAILGQFPRITLGFTGARDTSDVRTLTLGLSIDLPLFDRNQGAIVSAEATRQRMFDEYAQRLFEARHDLAAAIAEARLVVERIAHGDALIATLTDEAALIERALASGQIDAIAAQAVTLQLLQKRSEAVAQRQHLAELRIAIELAAGCLITSDAPARPGATKGER